jgi:methylated-DNA-[protein]-cysteine S-methyltransferase
MGMMHTSTPVMTLPAAELSWRTVDGPVGPLLLAATEHGLVRVAFARQEHDALLARLGEQHGLPVVHAPDGLDEIARQFDEYFAGRRTAFDLPLDLGQVAGFRRTVLDALVEVPYGRTVTYTELATAAGSPAAVRAAGSACATNPLPIVIPCHRVVRSDGRRGEYLGGLEARDTLLAIEGAA